MFKAGILRFATLGFGMILALASCGGMDPSPAVEPPATADVATSAVLTESIPVPPTPSPEPEKGLTAVPPTEIPPTPTPSPEPTATVPTPSPVPTRTEPLAVVSSTDLIFGLGPEGEEWQLDEYAPVEPGPWPLVVFLPGSGESKIRYKALGEALAGQGFIVSVIDYPKMLPIGAIIGRATGYRAMADTADCALRFTRERAALAGYDDLPSILAGFSLGAGVGAQVALAGDELEDRWANYELIGGAPRQVECIAGGESQAADAFIGIGGPYGEFLGIGPGIDFLEERDPEFLEMIQTLMESNADLKVRLLHGNDDRVVSPEQSGGFKTALRERGLDVFLTSFDGGHVVPRDPVIQAFVNLAGEWAGSE
jgi:acetyl esterase/lipase